jgi:NADPH:quinone reductase-like Zn-dependent oxidoreductase
MSLLRAVQVVSPGSLELADVPEPESTTHVVVQARQVGICGTDIKIVAGKIPVDYPRIVGHELVGEVVSEPDGAPFSPVIGSWSIQVWLAGGVPCVWRDDPTSASTAGSWGGTWIVSSPSTPWCGTVRDSV